MAIDKITTGVIADDAVTTAKVADDAVTAAKIPAGAVVADVGTGGIATANLADDAVTSAKLGADAVETAKVADDAVTYGKLQNLTAANRVLGSGSTGLIGEIQIATDMIAAGAITAAKVAADVATQAELDTVSAKVQNSQDDIAVLSFKIAANGSLAKYGLADQIVDSFEDDSGIDLAASTNEILQMGETESKFFSAEVVRPVKAAGGNSVIEDGEYLIHKYTSNGTYIQDANPHLVDVLVVAGGGSAGSRHAGGAGGGGVAVANNLSFNSTSYTVTVGTGPTVPGYNSGNINGVAGGNSTIEQSGDLLVAYGGGFGASFANAGGAGGSGGGVGESADNKAGGAATKGAGSLTQSLHGFPGGSDDSSPGYYGGSGGGGAGGPGVGGAKASGYSGGTGGIGYLSAITGTPTYYGGGGGGRGANDGTGAGGYGGAGGGGRGGAKSGQPPSTAGTNGTDGLGGGGGGGGQDSNGGDGGNGVVFIRRHKNVVNTTGQLTLVSKATASTLGSDPTKGDIVMTYVNHKGTATLNTDLKASISRDGGTTYTQFTLVSQGTTGGQTILSAHDLNISGQPSGTSMRYKIETANQTTSKITRIHAVSLGWS